MPSPVPHSKTVILAGAGHAHLHVTAHARSLRRHGIRVLLLDPGHFWYSGLTTGMLAGQYAPETDTIDPEALAERHGAIFLRDRLTEIHPKTRTARLASGECLRYDALSLNLGSHIAPAFDGAEPHAIPVKPIASLLALRRRLELPEPPDSTPIRTIAVVGGGPTGCEVAGCLASLARRRNRTLAVDLFFKTPTVLPALPPNASRAMTRDLSRLGVRLHPNQEIRAAGEDGLVDARGTYWPSEIRINAAGLVAPPRIPGLPPPAEPTNGIPVHPSLQSTQDDHVFAVGDCAFFESRPLPKLGVHAVRQAPVLHHNLQALLAGQPLKPYHPQKRCLTILNTGDGRALLRYGPFSWYGRIPHTLKDRIDRRFLRRYQ